MSARRIPYRDLAWRAVGACAIVVAGGSVRLLYAVAARDWGASVVFWSLALELSGFVLAILGVLLLVGGAKWHDRWKRGVVRVSSRSVPANTCSTTMGKTGEPKAERYVWADGARETAALLADRAIEAAAILKCPPASRAVTMLQHRRVDRRRPRAFR